MMVVAFSTPILTVGPSGSGSTRLWRAVDLETGTPLVLSVESFAFAPLSDEEMLSNRETMDQYIEEAGESIDDFAEALREAFEGVDLVKAYLAIVLPEIMAKAQAQAKKKRDEAETAKAKAAAGLAMRGGPDPTTPN